MGRIKTAFVKNIAKEIFEKYGDRFTTDFEKNKQAVKELIDIKSKRIRNIVAGYITTLKKQKIKQ